MLAEASRHVSSISQSVTLAARNPEKLAREIQAKPLVMDWSRQDETLAALSDINTVGLVLSWLHNDGLWLVEHLESKIIAGGRSILVHGSAARDPAILAKQAPPLRPDIQRQDVILGWVNLPNGRRWLSNEEISNAVIEAVDMPAQKVFIAGTVDA